MSGHLPPFFRWAVILIFFWLGLQGCNHEEKRAIDPVFIEISDVSDIKAISDTLVTPILYKNVGGFDTLTVEENKEKFVAVILPAILICKYRIRRDLETIKFLISKESWEKDDSVFYTSQMDRFNANDSTDLIIRMQTHPTSIVLAQAAVESGWGKSRFFSEANNLFGVWSYNPEKPRIAAKNTKRNIHLRKYKDISGSIMDYFETIARARAYRFFREVRFQTQDVDALLPYLKSYSENKMGYVNQLKKIIDQNDFTQYDRHRLDPEYIILQ